VVKKVTLGDVKLLTYPPSVVASGAVLVARRILNIECVLEWAQGHAGSGWAGLGGWMDGACTPVPAPLFKQSYCVACEGRVYASVSVNGLVACVSFPPPVPTSGLCGRPTWPRCCATTRTTFSRVPTSSGSS
jgi:hypothetical protein